MNHIHIQTHGKEESTPRGGTLLDLHKWHCHLFEKRGWMLLWKSDDMRIRLYHNEIVRLLDKLSYRYDKTTNDDTKIDLHNMMVNTEILLDDVKKNFSQILEQTAQYGGAKKTTKTKSKSKEKSKRKTKGRSAGR